MNLRWYYRAHLSAASVHGENVWCRDLRLRRIIRMSSLRQCNFESDAGSWRVALLSLEDVRALEAKWTDLQKRSACSFFQSWGWVGTWITTLPEADRPRILEVRLGERLVGLGLLGRGKWRRHRVIGSNALFLTETGQNQYDCLTVEHNGLLLDETYRATAVRHAVWGLRELVTWDEIFLSGIVRSAVPEYVSGAEDVQLRALVTSEQPYYFVDCQRVRAHGGDYLGILGRNTRYQIRRAMRAYEERGPIQFRKADTLESAQRFFEAMRDLHQAYWVSKGSAGAFPSEFTLAFHRKLIESRFSEGEIQIAEISAGSSPIGYLYNFVRDGVVYNYQSAFHYQDDSRLKPGLVSHCCAIQDSVDGGMKTYDLLMGTQRFKQNLATGSGEMVRLVLQKPKMLFRLETTLKRWRRQMQSRPTIASVDSNRAD